MLVVEQEHAARPERRDAGRPRVDCADARRASRGRGRRGPAAEQELGRKCVRVGVHPRQLGLPPPRRLDRGCVVVDPGDERAQLRRVLRLAAGAAEEVEDAAACPPVQALPDPLGDPRRGEDVLGVRCRSSKARRFSSVGSIGAIMRAASSRRRRRVSGRGSSRRPASRGRRRPRRCPRAVTRRPGRVRRAGPEHLLAVREVLQRAGLDDAPRDGVDADPARRQLDREVADERLERRLRGADERVVLEHPLRAEAGDADDRRAGRHLRRDHPCQRE